MWTRKLVGYCKKKKHTVCPQPFATNFIPFVSQEKNEGMTSFFIKKLKVKEPVKTIKAMLQHKETMPISDNN